MSEFDEESRLKEALIEKNGKKCHSCDKLDVPLSIEYLLGQKELEKQYFDKYERTTDHGTDYDKLLHTFYLNNFDEESAFVGLVCDNCKVIQKEVPSLEDALTLVDDFMNRGECNEFQLMIEKHPHTMPIINRRLRMIEQIALEEAKKRNLKIRNHNQQDNLGKKNV
jgi:hypothetical protein